jgi:hypothetical protein
VYRFLSLAVAALIAPAATADSPKRPNIVWIVVDDMSANFSCYDETAIRTPHVDALAAPPARGLVGRSSRPPCVRRVGLPSSPAVTRRRSGRTTTGAAGASRRSSCPATK